MSKWFRRGFCLVLWLSPVIPLMSFAAPMCVSTSGLSASQSLDILPAATVVAPWTNETPRELRSVERVDGRSAMRVDLRNWSPVAFDDSGLVVSGDFDALEMWLRSSRASPQLTLMGSAGVSCPLDALIELEPYIWQKLQIPLSSLGYTGSEPLGRLKLKSQVSDLFTVWVTGWRLIRSDPAPVIVESDDPPAHTPPAELSPSDELQPLLPTAIDLSVWQRDPGVVGKIGDHVPSIHRRLANSGADNQDDTDAFRQALLSLPARGGVLKIPAGKFFLNDSLRLRSGQVLRGASPKRTQLVFTRSLDQGIEIGGDYPGPATNVLEARKGSTRIRVENSAALRSGLYGLLSQTSSSASQVVKIVSLERAVGSVRLQLEEPLNASFVNTAKLRLFRAAEYAGIENLTLDVSTPEVKVGDMILLRSAANSWVRNVVSRRAFGAHVFTRQSYHCEIRDSIFDDATGHHDGKQGYGIDLANSTTGCLVVNNALRRLRHSILLQEGANGNVVALNYSTEPLHTNFVRGGPGDISFHGAANANLIEANVVERIHIGDAGAVGSGNAVLRNCLTSGPLTLENVPTVQYLAGNAMYGSDAELKNTFMPPLVPQTLQVRPYLKSNESLFDEDGIILTSALAEQPVAIGNWHDNQRWTQALPEETTIEIPSTLYGHRQASMLADPISGYWPDDCRIPAIKRLSNYK